MAMGILVFAGAMWAMVPATRSDLLPASAIASPFLVFACVSATIIPALLYPDTRDSTQNFTCNLIGFILNTIAAVPTLVIGLMMTLVWKASLWYTLIPVCLANTIIGAAGVCVSGAIFRRFDPTSE